MSTQPIRRLVVVFGLAAAVVVVGVTIKAASQPRPMTATKHHRIFKGAEAAVLVAQYEAENPVSKFMHQQRREAGEARGWVYDDQHILLIKGWTTLTQAPPRNIAERLSDWVDTKLMAQSCDELPPPLPPECADPPPDFSVTIYGADTGDAYLSAADFNGVTVVDNIWETITVDNSSGDVNAVEASLVGSNPQMLGGRLVNPTARWHDMPCSGDGDPRHVNLAIVDYIEHEMAAACIGASTGALGACAGTGVAYFLCLGSACLVGADAIGYFDVASFFLACHP